MHSKGFTKEAACALVQSINDNDEMLLLHVITNIGYFSDRTAIDYARL